MSPSGRSRSPRLRSDPVDHRLRNGIVVLTAAAILAYADIARDIPFVDTRGGRVVSAEFTSLQQVNERTPVRVRGVDVGRVDSVERDAERRVTVVRLRISDDDVELHRDARATVRWRTLLGGRMEVVLDPGSASAPALDGPIPRARTTSQVEIDDLLSIFDRPTVAGQRRVLRGLARGLGGSPAGATLEVLPAALRELRPAARALTGRRGDDLESLVRETARVTAALGTERHALSTLVSGARITFETTAGARRALGQTLEGAPGALDATRVAARRVRTLLPELDVLVDDLRPGARRLAGAASVARPAVLELADLLRRSRPLLRRLEPAVTSLALASGPGSVTLERLDPVVRRLGDELLPYLARVDSDAKLPTYQLIGPTLSTLSSAASEFDQDSFVVHFPPSGGESSASGLIPCDAAFLDPTAEQKLRCSDVNDVLDALLGGSP